MHTRERPFRVKPRFWLLPCSLHRAPSVTGSLFTLTSSIVDAYDGGG
eukprot:gene50285-66873_t